MKKDADNEKSTSQFAAAIKKACHTPYQVQDTRKL
jgi:hypothetical protein